MTKAARSRGFPEALREQIAAWDQLRSGCRSAHDLIRDVHAWLASQPADETEALRADIRELQRNALPSNCTRCNGLGAEPPGCPESGPCERCGGWTPHKLLVAGEAESLRAELAASCEYMNRLASSLLMIASEVDGDPKIDYRDYLDPRYTPALRQVGELRRDVEALRARVRELEAERDSALADMTLAREDLAGCEYDLAKLIRAVYDGRGIEDAANDAEMNGREGWLDVALDLAAPGPARCMRSERDSARAKAIEECALEVLATPSKGVVYTPDSLSSRAFVDKADVVEAIRALADRGAK